MSKIDSNNDNAAFVALNQQNNAAIAQIGSSATKALGDAGKALAGAEGGGAEGAAGGGKAAGGIKAGGAAEKAEVNPT